MLKIAVMPTEFLLGFMLRGSQAPRRAVCGTRGSLRTMHGGVSAPSCCAFIKSRDITLPTKVRLVKAMVFPVVMYGCES